MVEASVDTEGQMGLIPGDEVEDHFDSEELDDDQLNSMQSHSIAA